MFNNKWVSVVFLVKIQKKKNPQQSSSKRHSSKIKYLFFYPISLRPSGKKLLRTLVRTQEIIIQTQIIYK